MRIGIFSNARHEQEGGGVTFLLSIAAALAERHEVDLFFDRDMDVEALHRLLPAFQSFPNIRRTPAFSSKRVVGEVSRALFQLQYDLTIVQSSYVPGFSLGRRRYLLCEFPFARTLGVDDRLRLGTYQVVANSRFTAGWIEKLWGKPASVLHPPTVSVSPREKKPYLLGVGRFLDGGRSKQQLTLVQMFRRLCERGLDGWELHLAGFVQDEAYFARVRAEAEGLPVRFHPDLSRAELEALYGASSIFWHAVGLGVDQEREPGRMEHFGIVTVEAMSAGCVPVVINRGGQPEIVGPDAGVLWETPEACIDATFELATTPDMRADLAGRAMTRAKAFDYAGFGDRVAAVLETGEV